MDAATAHAWDANGQPQVHVSWYTRFQCVASALSHGKVSTEEAKWRWQEARRAGNSAPDVYQRLVDEVARCRGSEEAPEKDEKGDDQEDGSFKDQSNFPEVSWLPRWCLQPEGFQTPETASDPALASGAGATLWLGDIPSRLATTKRLNEILHGKKPSHMTNPFIRKVVKKNYRAPAAKADELNELEEKHELQRSNGSAGSNNNIDNTQSSNSDPNTEKHNNGTNNHNFSSKSNHNSGSDSNSNNQNGRCSSGGYGGGASVTPISASGAGGVDGDNCGSTGTAPTADEQPASDVVCSNNESKDPSQSNPPPWLGFAFITFRDAAEAQEGLELFDGLEVTGGWKLRASWADEQHQGGIKSAYKPEKRLDAGCHPPLGQQLFPVSFHSSELREALERHRRCVGLDPCHTEAWILAEAIKACYRLSPRREVRVEGQPVPKRLLDPLLAELRKTRWPCRPHRPGMQAASYLVLHRGKTNEGYDRLLELLCGTEGESLLSWADPEYGCSRVAVTRDFQGTPHIDASDVSYQYALSLGDFEEGGELCVESDEPDKVYMVNTHDRIARVDGRYVHWVRGFGDKERYSIIFFATNPAYAAERLRPFHEDFVPHGPS
eukprot:TRINITY_DN35739_c0_g1_i1.p1 TRINITY_DN35739_c0_g1~~TRINITY_DN35739_c0_g1_i1.p1  ORF type:complete len:608 (-),score=111.23 TRINITY_DN35739_c0_g1_i1:161-1984(-)